MSVLSHSIDNNKLSINSFAEELIKEKPKEFIESIKVSLEWTQLFFSKYHKDCPGSITNLLSFVSTVKKGFCIPKIARSSIKTFNSIISIKLNHLKTAKQKLLEVAKKVLKEVRIAIFNLTWDFYKLCDSLNKYNIVHLGKGIFLSRLKLIANICSSINSFEALYKEGKVLVISEKTIHQKSKMPPRIEKLQHILKIAEIVGRLSLGIIFFTSLLAIKIKFTLPIDTIILITTIAQIIFNKIYKDKDKRLKNY